jgi:ribosomal protein S18 acetylase RimI-like enzyme
MNNIEYRINTASKAKIESHLEECSPQFIPELNTYAVLEDYSEKLFDNAITFEAWKVEKLIGLIAVYCNDVTKKMFISSVSVYEDYKGIGLAKGLLNLCLDFGKVNKFYNVNLEVKKANLQAISFYEKHGFSISKDRGCALIMQYNQ